MKKSLNMNISGQIFQIDEDAYILLENYLKSLQAHFVKNGEEKELMSDFENRIAELLVEMNEQDNRIVDIDLVKRVINRIGKPEDIFEETNENASQQQQSFSYINGGPTGREDNQSFYNQPNDLGKKKFYRDVDRSLLCGVMSGIAAYTGWDLTAIRVIMVILMLVSGGFFWIFLLGYLACWMLVPAATTATQRLEMYGKPITVENIGQTINNDAQTYSRPDDSVNKVGGCMLRGCLGCFGIIILFFVMIFILAIVGGFIDNISDIPADWTFNYNTSPTLMFYLSIVASAIILVVPITTLIHSLTTKNNVDSKPIPRWIKITGMTLWFISIIFLIFVAIFYATGEGINMFMPFHNIQVHSHEYSSGYDEAIRMLLPGIA